MVFLKNNGKYQLKNKSDSLFKFFKTRYSNLVLSVKFFIPPIAIIPAIRKITINEPMLPRK